MNLGQRFLRFMSRDNEDLRQDMRHSMAMIEAHTEDLTRTMTLDGEAIRAAIARFRNVNDPEATLPQ